MFINKTKDGRNNICGKVVAQVRTSMKLSQRALADKLQLYGLDIDKNAIQRIESGQRFVTDIEIIALAKVLETDLNTLLNTDI
ncbi:MAG: helix-turn-helix transcriptional regulator [Clostridia bacterium]|nr:helix-turn-helix transcriptional regulator [Clostridia bacterium]